ncbi:MAG: SPFH domain-containing protein [Campylobacterota bacterium]
MPADMNDYFKKKTGQNKNSGGSNSGGNGGGGGGPKFPEPPNFNNMGKKAIWIYALIILVVVVVLARPFHIINSGEVGIKKTAGKYNPQPLQPGFHFYLPGLQEILVMDTKVRIVDYTSQEDMSHIDDNVDGVLRNPAITILDSRGLPVGIEMTVQYRLMANSAPQTVANWGLNWEDKIINPVVRDVVRSVVGGFNAEELPMNRGEISAQIKAGLTEDIDALEGQPVTLLSIQLREIVLPPKIKDQIERVQIARQEAERAKYRVEQAKQKAEQRAAKAQGDADANRIEAKGRADAVTIEADAQAKANKLIAASLTNDLLQLEQVKIQGKFNEALRENKDAKIFLTPGGSTPNLWVDMKQDSKTKTSVNQ